MKSLLRTSNGFENSPQASWSKQKNRDNTEKNKHKKRSSHEMTVEELLYALPTIF
ncbi:hypothetical protein BPJM79_20050 [Bacillus pumilus]